MSSDRPYRKGKGIDAALEEIEIGSGKLFDESVVAACLKIFREDGYILPQFI
jgi:HD-GYP domain-containing protein (c-di-GMP phosphodiesterase class II)